MFMLWRWLSLIAMATNPWTGLEEVCSIGVCNNSVCSISVFVAVKWLEEHHVCLHGSLLQQHLDWRSQHVIGSFWTEESADAQTRHFIGTQDLKQKTLRIIRVPAWSFRLCQAWISGSSVLMHHCATPFPRWCDTSYPKCTAVPSASPCVPGCHNKRSNFPLSLLQSCHVPVV